MVPDPTSSIPPGRSAIGWSAAPRPQAIRASKITGGKVVRSRPLCVYPEVARYKGTGSIDDFASFTCVKP